MKLALPTLLFCAALMVGECAPPCDCFRKCGKTRQEGWCGGGSKRFFFVRASIPQSACTSVCQNVNSTAECAVFDRTQFDQVEAAGDSILPPFNTAWTAMTCSQAEDCPNTGTDPDWTSGFIGSGNCVAVIQAPGWRLDVAIGCPLIFSYALCMVAA